MYKLSHDKFKLAYCYVTGTGIEKDEEKAYEYLKGDKHLSNWTVPKQLDNFVYREGLKKNVSTSNMQLCLGMWYGNPAWKWHDNKVSVELLHQSAINGNKYAQMALGNYYSRMPSPDNAKCLEWYNKAAMQGLSSAQEEMGYIYLNGRFGCEKSAEEAAKWFIRASKGEETHHADSLLLKAANLGNPCAQNLLGNRYYYANEGGKDDKEAFKWYMMAAKQGYAEAQRNVGLCYEYGEGIEKNHEESIKWLEQAAKNGDERAKEYIKSH